MSLYAFDAEELIHASFAQTKTVYQCPDCLGPVKRRTGRFKLAHFYHLNTAPNCRLYSKTDHHRLAQIQLEREFPPGALTLERRFSQIHRIADLCWEREKIVFEIQCSPLTEQEAAQRMEDYRSIGYETVWLLDDRRYNQRLLRPAEEWLRKKSSYYISIQQGPSSKIYDQLEIFCQRRRVLCSRPMVLDLQKMYRHREGVLEAASLPTQIAQLEASVYFQGDRLHRALQNRPLSMLRWKALELHRSEKEDNADRFRSWFQRNIARFYFMILEKMLSKN